jgi:hypothetical protein
MRTAAEIEAASVLRRQEILRHVLPDCQPQEGSPANTFTRNELQELQDKLKLSDLKLVRKARKDDVAVKTMDIVNDAWEAPPPQSSSSSPPQSGEGDKEKEDSMKFEGNPALAPSSLPPLHTALPRAFRKAVRAGAYTGPTNGVCPGYLQCNLVVLPAGQSAFDFLLFCQRNSKACPLLEVCEGANSSFQPRQLADGVDLRMDIPK